MTLDEYRAERAATKRAAILDAAEESFRKEGFARTSMEAVANNARVSTATLYRYFPAKPELFELACWPNPIQSGYFGWLLPKSGVMRPWRNASTRR